MAWFADNSVGLLTFLAELVVAYVIFLEVEHSRDSSFLEKATSKDSDKDRREIYKAFFAGQGSREDMVKRFEGELWKPDPSCLRMHCHNQLAMFHEMGFQANRKFWWRRKRRERYVSVFPHAPIFFWFIASDYVKKRRELTGPWFGTNALIFIRESIDYVLQNTTTGKITVGLPGNENKFDLTREDIEKMKVEVQKLIDESPGDSHRIRRRVISLLLIGGAICAVGAFVLLSCGRDSVPRSWHELSIENSGFGWKSEALFNVDIPLPTASVPHGQYKFLDRSDAEAKKIELGYVVKVSVEHLDTSKIPGKYRQPRKEAGWETEPPKEVVYSAHLEFTVKDADGFVLMSAKSSAPLYLSSGQENVFQGTTQELIPLGVAQRAKTILMGLTVDRCETCY